MTSSSGFTEHEIVILQHTAHARKFNDLLAKAGAKPPQATFFEIGETLSPALVMELSERAAKGAYIILAGDRVPMGSDAAASVSFLGARHPLEDDGLHASGFERAPLPRALLFTLRKAAPREASSSGRMAREHGGSLCRQPRGGAPQVATRLGQLL